MNRKRVIGYLLMIIATLIPLYLSSSMSLDILTKKNKHNDFLNSYNKQTTEELKNIQDKSLKYENKISGENKSVDPFAQEGYDVDYKILEDSDAVFAYITVPAIDVSEPIYLGATEKHLVSGFAHVDGTSLPIGGLNKRSVIAGHRGGYYGRLDLLNAHKIEKGDILRIDLGRQILTYKMISREIIKPSEWEKLKPIPGHDIITLLTCDPFPTAQNRMLVNFERVEEASVNGGSQDTQEKQNDMVEKRNNFFTTNKSSVNFMKYSLYISSIFFSILLLVLIVKLIKIISGKKQ